jgi:hypothetical protein
MKPRTKRILNGCLALLLLAFIAFMGFCYYLGSIIEESLQDVTDVSRYTEIKETWPTNLVRHFPDKAPHPAVFFYQPGFLQGGSALQLKVAMSPTDLAAELSKISPHVLVTYQGGGRQDHRNSTNGIPTTDFFTSGTTNTLKFPDDYAIMVIEANDRNGGFPWNHGSTAGIAISTQRNMVVYWAELW